MGGGGSGEGGWERKHTSRSWRQRTGGQIAVHCSGNLRFPLTKGVKNEVIKNEESGSSRSADAAVFTSANR